MYLESYLDSSKQTINYPTGAMAKVSAKSISKIKSKMDLGVTADSKDPAWSEFYRVLFQLLSECPHSTELAKLEKHIDDTVFDKVENAILLRKSWVFEPCEFENGDTPDLINLFDWQSINLGYGKKSKRTKLGSGMTAGKGEHGGQHYNLKALVKMAQSLEKLFDDTIGVLKRNSEDGHKADLKKFEVLKLECPNLVLSARRLGVIADIINWRLHLDTDRLYPFFGFKPSDIKKWLFDVKLSQKLNLIPRE